MERPEQVQVIAHLLLRLRYDHPGNLSEVEDLLSQGLHEGTMLLVIPLSAFLLFQVLYAIQWVLWLIDDGLLQALEVRVDLVPGLVWEQSVHRFVVLAVKFDCVDECLMLGHRPVEFRL